MIERKERKMGPLVTKLENVGFSTYDRVLFRDLDLSLQRETVTAVTGKSGSGKSVLLRVAAGKEKPEKGMVKPNPKEVGYVPQIIENIDFDSESSIGNFLFAAKGLDGIQAQIKSYEEQLSNQPEDYEFLANGYSRALEEFEEAGGYRAEADAEKLLSGLNVDRYDRGNITLQTKLGEISSGQLRKVMLARALFIDAELLVLDDPTIHLDRDSVDWLSNYLKETDSAVMTASNDRDFIDECADKVVGLTDTGRVFVFPGGYTEFERRRNELMDTEQGEVNKVKRKLEQLEETDKNYRQKNAYKRSPNMAQVGRALETRMDRLRDKLSDLPGSEKLYREDRSRQLVFEAERRSGKTMVVLDGKIEKYYGEHQALSINPRNPIVIGGNDKWLVQGPNGSGKTTLVELIHSKVTDKPDLSYQGRISTGRNIEVGIYNTESAENTVDNPENTLLKEGFTVLRRKDRKRVASVLRFFGFRDKAIYHQPARTLSFGERKKMALAKLMLGKPNLLILDEPTGDYLTLEMKERLAKALQDYDGTLILVSHDEEFVNLMDFDQVLEMPTGKVKIPKREI